jgi:hypothetical protein
MLYLFIKDRELNELIVKLKFDEVLIKAKIYEKSASKKKQSAEWRCNSSTKKGQNKDDYYSHRSSSKKKSYNDNYSTNSYNNKIKKPGRGDIFDRALHSNKNNNNTIEADICERRPPKSKKMNELKEYFTSENTRNTTKVSSNTSNLTINNETNLTINPKVDPPKSSNKELKKLVEELKKTKLNKPPIPEIVVPKVDININTSIKPKE